MKRSWIKLYVEILDDPKMGRLPDGQWRKAVELFLMAAKMDQDGLLPPVDDIVWQLRAPADEIEQVLQALAAINIVHQAPEGWVVTHFKARQHSESYERVKRYRERESNADSNAGGNAAVAENESPSTSSSSSPSDSVSRGGGTGEGKKKKIPATPRQAAEDPDIMVFQEVSGRIPGDRDYATVIDTIQFLRERHGDKLVEYLKPYWLAWSTRKTREGRLYQPNSMTWLTEWAVNAEIPAAHGSSAAKTDREAVIRKVAQNANATR